LLVFRDFAGMKKVIINKYFIAKSRKILIFKLFYYLALWALKS
jgi:hypothetical protein